MLGFTLICVLYGFCFIVFLCWIRGLVGFVCLFCVNTLLCLIWVTRWLGFYLFLFDLIIYFDFLLLFVGIILFLGWFWVMGIFWFISFCLVVALFWFCCFAVGFCLDIACFRIKCCCFCREAWLVYVCLTCGWFIICVTFVLYLIWFV